MGSMDIAKGGKMWIETALILRRAVDQLKRRGLVTKDTAFFSDCGLSENEGYNKIAYQPRTPLTYGEFLMVLKTIQVKDKDVYIQTLRNLFQDDSLTVNRFDLADQF